MTTFTWVAGNTGDWTSIANWTSSAVPGTGDSAFIPGHSTHYVAQIGTADSEIINSLTLGDFTGTGQELEIAGTLQFAGSNPAITFVQGTIQVDSTGVLEGTAGGTYYGGITVHFINNGTVDANGGSGTPLIIESTFTNSGTVIADNGIVLLGGAGLANMSGSTLTGGTWIASGPASGTFNQIEIGGSNFDAVITTDAANIVLDGVASDIEGFQRQPSADRATTADHRQQWHAATAGWPRLYHDQRHHR